MKIIDIQKHLHDLGFNPGPRDGKSGAKTTNAVIAFQISRGLAPDDRVGPLTAADLAGDDTPETRDRVAEPAVPSAAFGAWPLQKDCMAFYGGVGLNQKMLALPFPMKLAWKESVIVNRVSAHEKVHGSAGRAFAKIAQTYDDAVRKSLGIDLFGGPLNVRRMRGGTAYSMHSWGIVIDFDPERDALKTDHTKARLAKPDAVPFWEIWEKEVWISLGRQRDFDWMHVQAARLK